MDNGCVKLSAIKEFLTESTWIKGRYTNSKGCMCLEGAIRYLGDTYKIEDWAEAHTYVQRAIFKLFPSRRYYDQSIKPWFTPELVHIPSFNDHPDTTLADVIAVLEEAMTYGNQDHGV